MNSIIKNLEFTSFNFKTIEDVNKYRFMSTTDQSNAFASSICENIKAISDDIIYYFNKNTKLWEKVDNHQYESFVYDWFNNTAKIIKKILKKTENIDEQVEKKIKELCSQFDKAVYISQIMKRSFSKLYDTQFITKLDSLPDFLPISEGNKINLRTLKVTERESKDFFTYESPVRFIEGETKHADKFFSQLQPDKNDREYLRKILGYSLTGETKARVFFVWYGHGANGKSKVFKIMEKISQGQYAQCDKSIFMKMKKSNTGATPEIMDLMGKRVGVYSEGETADNIEMNLGGLKQVSGEDKITGRPLYCAKVDFYPYIKLHMLTNFTPPLNAEKAIKDRLRYVFMDSEFCDNPKTKNQFKIDHDFASKLENEYLSEVFTWIVKGAKEYYKDEKIEMTESVSKRTNEILNQEDSIKTFFDRKIKITNDNKDKMKKLEIFETYRDFCNSNSQRCQPRSSLFNRMEQMGIKKSVLDGYDVFRGIVLDEQENENDENPLDHGINEDVPDYKKLYLEAQEKIAELEEKINKLKIEPEEVKNIDEKIITSKKKKTKKKSDKVNLDDILNDDEFMNF